LNALPEESRLALEKIRAAIKSTAPKAEEVISYGMPGYKYFGPLVYMAAFKDHLSFFPGSSQIIKLYDELKDFKTAKGTIQFTVDKPLPTGIVKRIVKARMAENEARQAARQLKKPMKKTGKVSAQSVKEDPQVSAYMKALKGIQKEEINAVRELTRKASAKLTERIKWNAPSYYYKKDIVTFGPYKPGKLLLVFHHPAVVKVKSDLLQGDYKDRRLVYFKDAREAVSKKKELARIIQEIIKQID
jgi:uncharacterized protein YdhG (YjbR/CyaY superfamily)